MIGFCHQCNTEEGRFWDLLDISKTSEDWSKHVRTDSHLPPVDFDVHKVIYQNGTLDTQFSIETVAGFSSIKDVHNFELGVEVGDVLVMFNHEDLRNVTSDVYNEMAKNVKDFTICEALFFRPPFSPEYLDKKLCSKVRFIMTSTFSHDFIFVFFPSSYLNQTGCQYFA